MLTCAAVVLSGAAALGILLAALHAGSRRPHWGLGVGHGALGAAGFLLLLIALRGPPRGVAMGAGQFGTVAAVLLALALLAASGPMVARFRRRPMPGLVLGLHATLAIMGVVMVLAYVSMPAG